MPNIQIPHIILTVKDFEVSKKFYNELFVHTLGCNIKIDEEDFLYIRLDDKTDLSLGIVPENTEFNDNIFNRYSVGLHHFAVELESRNVLLKAYTKVKELGMKILDEPQVFTDYGEDYFAFYYLDPNGFKNEFVTFN